MKAITAVFLASPAQEKLDATTPALFKTSGLDPLALFAALVALVGVLFVGRQIRDAREAYIRQNEIDRRTATFNFYDAHRESLRDQYYSIKEELGLSPGEALRTEHIKELDDNPRLLKEVRAMLSTYERFAMAVEEKIYDYNTVDRLSRSAILEVVADFGVYIDAAQQRNARLYESLIWLARKLRSNSHSE
jgi:hypothetical protein